MQFILEVVDNSLQDVLTWIVDVQKLSVVVAWACMHACLVCDNGNVTLAAVLSGLKYMQCTVDHHLGA